MDDCGLSHFELIFTSIPQRRLLVDQLEGFRQRVDTDICHSGLATHQLSFFSQCRDVVQVVVEAKAVDTAGS